MVCKDMEPLSRTFSARTTAVMVPAFLLVGLELFILALLPFDGLFVGNIGIMVVILTILFAAGILGSRLYLQASDETFSTTVRLFGLTLFHRSVRGVSWHPISFSSRSIEGGSNDFTRYRVEVSISQGDRLLAMGSFLGWIYGVDCL